MRQHRWSSLIFLLGVLLVFSALGWVTWHALRLERGELVARAEARYQENIRLALWRMDSAISPILAREAARPYFEYHSFYPADRAYTRLLNQVEPGEVLVPSPLLQPAGPFVKLHFETSADGEVTSPQVPTGPMRQLAESVYVSGYSLALSEQSLSQLTQLLAPPQQLGAVREEKQISTQDLQTLQPEGDEAGASPQQRGAYQTQGKVAQQRDLATSANEYQSRARHLDQAQQQVSPPRQVAMTPQSPAMTAAPAASAPTVSAPGNLADRRDNARKDEAARTGEAPMADRRAGASPTKAGEDDVNKAKDANADSESGSSFGYADAVTPGNPPLLVGASDAGVVQREFMPLWLPAAAGAELVYTRQVTVPHASFTQGFWVDWTALSASLIASVHDLLPDATLRPLPSVPAADDLAVLGRSLASVPAELVAPMPVVEPIALGVMTPVRSTLLATWIAALGAVLAIALVLRASLELAERRGRFVSAVTHELRTPLTTFCLYSQMLADGMVPTEEGRRSYARTLNTESQRLARIVESVLDYARLGHSKGTGGKASIEASELWAKVIPPLAARCDQTGMELVIEGTDLHGAIVHCDPAQVERVLYNLVDNACKYAVSSDDKRLHLSATRSSNDLLLTVRDHGPGIGAREQRRVFRPFIRGQQQIDGSIPGLGLGLSLAEGLAKECGGDLRLIAPDGGGAEFRLRMPITTTG